MPLALVRTEPLERLLTDLSHRLTAEEHTELRRRFEHRRRVAWYRILRRALRGTDEVRCVEIRLRARAFPRAPRDDMDLSFRRIAAARAEAVPNDRRSVTRHRTRTELHRLVGDTDARVTEVVVDLVTEFFYPHLPF